MSDGPIQFPDEQSPEEPEYIELIEAQPVDPHPNHPHPPTYHPQAQPPQPHRQRRRYEDVALGALAVFGIHHIHEKVTGCIVSAIFLPLFLIVFGGIVYTSMKSSNDRHAQRNAERAAEKLKSEISTTQRNLQNASDRVQREARRLHRLPHDDEGSRLMIGMRDGWEANLQYEIVDERHYVIRSNGPDQKRNTDDDLITEKASLVVFANGPNAIASNTGTDGSAEAPIAAFELDDLSPKTKSIVTRLVNSTSYRDSSESLQELATMQPVEADCDQVVSVAINYTRELRLAGLAAQAVRNWATAGQSQLIADYLLEGSIRGTGATDDLVQTLVETKAEDAMLRLINHPRTAVADLALESVRAWGADDITLARQHVDDLKTITVGTGNWLTALKRLESLPIEEDPIRQEINDTLIPLIAENPSRLEEVYEVLKKTITADDLEALLVYRSRQNEKQIVTILAEMQDPLAYQTIVEIAIDSNEERALTILRADIGSMAESYVWPYLENDSFTKRKQAVNLLATIGTSESLSRLEKIAADDRFVGNEAKIAIRLIKKRMEAEGDRVSD